MKQNKIQIIVGGQLISAVLSIPNADSDKIIVMAHGGPGGNKNGPNDIFIFISESLCNNGYATLRFDFRGSGESDGEFENTTIAGEAKDLRSVINYAQEKGYKKIGLIGESLGGTIALIDNHKLCDALVLWYPAIYLNETSFSEILHEENLKIIETVGYWDMGKVKLGKEFIDELLSLNLESNLDEIIAPTLFLHGTIDNDVPLNQSQRAFGLVNAEKELEIFDEGGHGLRRPSEQKRVIELTLNWFEKFLN